MFCTKCGKEIEEGSQFCVYCGSQVISKSDTPKKKKSYIWILALLVIIIICFIIYYLSSCTKKQNEDIVSDIKEDKVVEENTPIPEEKEIKVDETTSESSTDDYVRIYSLGESNTDYTTYLYDDNGILVTSINNHVYDWYYYLRTITSYEYDVDNNLVKTVADTYCTHESDNYTYLEPVWGLRWRTERTYEDNKLKHELQYYIDKDGNRTNIMHDAEYYYTYDADNKLIDYECKDNEQEVSFHFTSIKYIDTPRGYKISYSHPDGNKHRVEEYQYNDDGMLSYYTMSEHVDDDESECSGIHDSYSIREINHYVTRDEAIKLSKELSAIYNNDYWLFPTAEIALLKVQHDDTNIPLLIADDTETYLNIRKYREQFVEDNGKNYADTKKMLEKIENGDKPLIYMGANDDNVQESDESNGNLTKEEIDTYKGLYYGYDDGDGMEIAVWDNNDGTVGVEMSLYRTTGFIDEVTSTIEGNALICIDDYEMISARLGRIDGDRYYLEIDKDETGYLGKKYYLRKTDSPDKLPYYCIDDESVNKAIK